MSDQLALSDRDLLVRIDTRMDIVVRRVDDHELRLRLLEKFGWTLVGTSVAISFLLSTAAIIAVRLLIH